MFKRTIKLALLPLAIGASFAQAADVSKAELKQQLDQIQQRLAELEKEPQTTAAPKAKEESRHTLNFYGTLRPTFGVNSTDDGSNWDVGDALSRIGIATEHKLNNGLTAFAKGEFKVNIQANGDFGEARKAYVGVKGDFGRVAIGKQASTQYNMIADPVDIFNRASTPLAYDHASPFRVNNLVTYRKSFGDFDFSVDGQFDGSDGDSGADLFNSGLQYSANGLRAAVAYYSRDAALGAEDSAIGFSVSKSFGDLYLAASYQDREITDFVEVSEAGASIYDASGSTLDLVAAYKINSTYKAKFGVSVFEDGKSGFVSNDFNAYNATIEYHTSPDFYMFAEVQQNDFEFEHNPDSTQFNVGFRYNFDVGFNL